MKLGLKQVPVIDPLKVIPRITSNLNLKESIKRQALQIMGDIKQNKIHEGKNPVVIAAAAVYAACKIEDRDSSTNNKDNKTQIEIAKSVGISDSVLRKWYNGLC